jgi:cytidylate kinase
MKNESQKTRIITLAGRPGSGKSSTAKAVATNLGYQHFSSGDLFRALAREQGIDLLQANLSAEQNAELDHLVDGRLQLIGTTEERIVIDSRTAWHWMPNSFKVFLDLDLTVAAERILNDMDDERLASEHVHRDVDEYSKHLQQRLDSESRRYKKLYDIDPYVTDNYDLVVDTATNDLKQVIDIVLTQYRRWLEESGIHL